MDDRRFIKKIKYYFLFLFISTVNAQHIQKEFYKDSLSREALSSLHLALGKNKSFDSVYKKQILLTLSYFPELKDVKVKFRLKETNTPLSSRPTFWSLFRAPKKRTYSITISTKTNKKLAPILFEKLSYNAQIGVLGHELSHISDYTKKDFFQMCTLLGIELFSKIQVDRFESRTDQICINHGLGFQLLDWSKSVRENLKIDNWRGADNIDSKSKRERYLNPQTIIQILKNNQLYFTVTN